MAIHLVSQALKLAAAGTTAFLILSTQTAWAQKWPEKPVRIVTPFAPGGGTDVFARILAQRLSEVFAQQFIVENRPGAGSTIGTEHVARSAPDGYTYLMTSASYSFNPGLYPKLRYDPVKDFTAVSLVVRVPHVIVVLPSFPARNLQEFVKLARARPGDVLYASSGPGSAMHLAGALFGIVTKTNLTHVPYKGGAATVAAVMSGEATTAFNTLETVIGQIRGKRVRPLAVSTRERAAAIPDVPTAAEAGIKDYEAIGWFGLLAPAATPPAVIQQLSGEIAKAMATPAMRDRATQEGATPIGSTPAEFQRFVQSEIVKWTRIIHAAGIKLE
ncbi:MAG TPA: tripartite tricarboxylate transporter substrate binding protein [Burkholderiales bacterium]|nr:tripartite tricarboxylate transporter substrate binding protein [Burkholderiales bacterium]